MGEKDQNTQSDEKDYYRPHDRTRGVCDIHLGRNPDTKKSARVIWTGAFKVMPTTNLKLVRREPLHEQRSAGSPG
jgi:hypothetical protein